MTPCTFYQLGPDNSQTNSFATNKTIRSSAFTHYVYHHLVLETDVVRDFFSSLICRIISRSTPDQFSPAIPVTSIGTVSVPSTVTRPRNHYLSSSVRDPKNADTYSTFSHIGGVHNNFAGFTRGHIISDGMGFQFKPKMVPYCSTLAK